jgi:diadenosine tetraphosphate (Ap4A) HIT family hydrolase
LQRIVYRVGEAVRRTVPTERLYVLALGTREGNSHVHWHVAPLPPGVPYAEQQLEALRVENGVLDVSGAELDELAAALRVRLRGDSPTHLP